MGVLLDETLLAGANVVDMNSRSYFPSLARLAIGEKMRRQTIAEELRVLYVAMTRAKEVLVMSYCASRLSSVLKKWNEALTLPLPPRTAASVLCLGDWVLLTALCRTEAGELFAETGPNEVSAVQSDPWVIRLHHSADLQARLRAPLSGRSRKNQRTQKHPPRRRISRRMRIWPRRKRPRSSRRRRSREGFSIWRPPSRHRRRRKIPSASGFPSLGGNHFPAGLAAAPRTFSCSLQSMKPAGR